MIARVTGASRSGDDVSWTWNGYDPRLQTHTAGFRDFDVQYRVGSGDGGRSATTRPEVPDLARPATWPVLRDPRARDRPPWQCGGVDGPVSHLGALTGSVRRHPFAAVNFISDPIHGYIELTKRLGPAESAAAGLPAEDVAEEDLLDTAWLQRLRRISQLQSARWVFPTAEHSRFTHGLGVMHEAGPVGALALPEPAVRSRDARDGAPIPSEGLVAETLRMAGLLHDVGHGPFAHFFDDHVLADFEAPADPRRAGRQAAHP